MGSSEVGETQPPAAVLSPGEVESVVVAVELGGNNLESETALVKRGDGAKVDLNRVLQGREIDKLDGIDMLAGNFVGSDVDESRSPPRCGGGVSAVEDREDNYKAETVTAVNGGNAVVLTCILIAVVAAIVNWSR
jgi:hypothetical protein